MSLDSVMGVSMSEYAVVDLIDADVGDENGYNLDWI